MSDSKTILLAAAAEQFAKYGPKGTRVQDIVHAAGINERMIYHHFGSKAGLYAAVMREQRTRLGEAWWPVLEKSATMDPYAGMHLALGGFFDILLARPQVAALLAHEGLGDAPLALPEGVTGLPEPVRSLYERGQAEGVFPAAVPFEIPRRPGRRGRDPAADRRRRVHPVPPRRRDAVQPRVRGAPLSGTATRTRPPGARHRAPGGPLLSGLRSRVRPRPPASARRTAGAPLSR